MKFQASFTITVSATSGGARQCLAQDGQSVFAGVARDESDLMLLQK